MANNEAKIHNTFAKALNQLENLRSAFRPSGKFAQAVTAVGGDTGYLQDIDAAFSELLSVMNEAEYGMSAHMSGALGTPEESVQEGDQCNMTMEGEHCPMHGMDECSGSMPQSNELSSLKVLAGL
jgi:hypothetical protein